MTEVSVADYSAGLNFPYLPFGPGLEAKTAWLWVGHYKYWLSKTKLAECVGHYTLLSVRQTTRS